MPGAMNSAIEVMQGKKFVERPDIERIRTVSKYIDWLTIGLGKYIPRAMEAVDVLVRTMIEEGERAALTQRYGKTKTAIEINKEAYDRAEYGVFRQPIDPENKSGQGDVLSYIDKMTSLVYKLRSDIPLSRWFIRFVQTPMAILKQGIEYSPLGFSALKGNTNKKEQIGKAMIGSLVFAGASALAMKDRTTWALPKDQKDRDFFYQAGMQPYSINIAPEGKPAQWVSFSQLGPLSYPIAMAAALHYHTKEASTALSDTVMNKSVKVLVGSMEFFSDQSYVRTLGDFIKSLQGDMQSVKNIITTMPEQMIPLSSLQGWVNSLIDPLYRKPERDINWESIVDNLQKKIIFSSQFVPAAKDIFGKPQVNKDRFINAVSPLKYKIGDADFQRIYDQIQQAKQIKSLSDKNANDTIKKYEKLLKKE